VNLTHAGARASAVSLLAQAGGNAITATTPSPKPLAVISDKHKLMRKLDN